MNKKKDKKEQKEKEIVNFVRIGDLQLESHTETLKAVIKEAIELIKNREIQEYLEFKKRQNKLKMADYFG